MPSPFPGMNPYLEHNDAWHDFHERFIPLIAEILGAQVRPDYIVKIDEHVYVHKLPEETRRFLGRGDATIHHSPGGGQVRPAVGLLDAPIEVHLPAVDYERLDFLEIRDRRSRQVITVVELLSPSNKRPGSDLEQYRFKRGQILASMAHFVEIDLLRGGESMPADNRPECAYSVMVSRYEDRPRAGFWPIGLRDRLPAIPIPLRQPDPDARLDLQEALHQLYDRAGYEDYIYEGTPDPALAPDDAAWAGAFVPRAG